MGRPLRIEYPGAFYHVTSRGNEQKEIFKSDRDREQFLGYLESAGIRYDAVIHAYCLMGNHYHLLIETPSGNLSEIMRHINGAYTNYFNAKRKRAGHLLQGRFKAILIDGDEYAKELSRYIHLNPVRAGIAERPEEYKWSSYGGYVGECDKPAWLKTEFILGYFDGMKGESQRKYRQFVNSLIGKEYESPLTMATASTMLGRSEFVDEITEKYLGAKQGDRNVPALGKLSKRPTIETITKAVRAAIKDDEAIAKAAALYFCHRHSGLSLREIGANFGIGESAVSQASRRFALKASKDKKLSKTIEAMEGAINESKV